MLDKRSKQQFFYQGQVLGLRHFYPAAFVLSTALEVLVLNDVDFRETLINFHQMVSRDDSLRKVGGREDEPNVIGRIRQLLLFYFGRQVVGCKLLQPVLVIRVD